MENLLTIKNNEGREVPVIDSREVAKMLGKGHAELLRDIDGRDNYVGIIPTLEKANLALSNYFIPSTYKAGTREYKCYLCTKMGCELLGNKQQGEKGILFTAKYVERFNQYEAQLKQQLTSEDSLMLRIIKSNSSEERAVALGNYRQYKDEEAKRLAEASKEEGYNNGKDLVLREYANEIRYSEALNNDEVSYDIGDVSKVLNISGMGRNNLFKFLRDEKMLMKNNEPYQAYAKYFKFEFINKNDRFVSKTTIKGSDIKSLIKRLAKKGYITSITYNEAMERLNRREELETKEIVEVEDDLSDWDFCD